MIHSTDDRCVATNGKVVIKVSIYEQLVKREVETLTFLNGINYPECPTLVDSGSVGDYFFITKEFIEGETLEKVMRKMSHKELISVMEDIVKELNKIHSMSPTNLERTLDNYYVNEVCYKVEKFREYKHLVLEKTKEVEQVFCHGDLHPRNIIINDKKLAGFIDWEFSGYYPMSSEGSFERFWNTPGCESFSRVYESLNIPQDLRSLEHVIYCIKTDKISKAEQILNKIFYSF